MAQKVKLFNDQAIDRISTNVKWGEGVRSRQLNIPSMPTKANDYNFHVQLLEKDYGKGGAGYWKAQEVIFENGKWELYDGGREFDDNDYPAIRHVEWEDSRVGAIVKPFQIRDVAVDAEKPYIWVFEEEVTNPEAFIFYADNTGGTAQSDSKSTWSMPKGGMIYTNYGEMEVPDNFSIDAGESAWCKIEFVWMFNEWQIASAEMTNEEGEYWEEDYGTLIIHVKIVSTKINKDICRLTQHTAGDIRFELRENVAVNSGNDWIVVTSRNNGRLYTVYHTLPNPPKPLNDFLAFAGNCNDMPLNDFGAWAEWARRNIVHIKYDQLGHIYERENCYDGEVERVDPPEEDPENDPQELTSQLTAPLFASNLQPWAMQGGDGFVPTYTVLKGGNLFTDFVGVEQVMFIARNSQQQLVKVATNPAAAFPTFDINKLEFAKNVNGTSGQAYNQMVLAQRNFRFNDTLTVRAGMAGLGLPQQVDLTTANIQSVVSHPTGTTVRKWDDPNASSDYEVYVSFAPPVAGSLNTANYFVELSFRWADGSPVQISSNNQLDIIGDGEVRAQITADDDYTFPYQLSDATDRNAGDAIKITARVIYIDAGDGHVTDANITDSMLIYYSNESDCYVDEEGGDLVDESGDCYSEDTSTVPYVPNDIYHIKLVTPAQDYERTNGTFTLLSDTTHIFNNIDAGGW